MTDISRTVSLIDLDRRARSIFREIVEAYLETGEPVGSRTIARRGVQLSPASIRNTMQDLALLGLLDAPHLSAGRTPTNVGLRLFVDGLLEIGELSSEAREEIDARLAPLEGDRSGLLSEASRLLSGLAGGAGLVVTPKQEMVLKHVELVGLGPGQALAVLVGEDGAVENRVMATPPGLTPAALQEASLFLLSRLRGRTLSEARADILEEVRAARAALDSAAAQVIEDGLADWSGGEGERNLIVRGRANLLADAQAAADLERVRLLFDDLERKKDLIQLLDGAGEADAVRIFIGAENPLFSLSGSSVVTAPYMNADRKIIGALGVIGPTRLNYARVIPMVDYTARAVGRLLDGRAKGEDR
jgi:heat-inducible transcriptional repressor